MTTFRVGTQGARVVSVHGQTILRLQPGMVIEGEILAEPADEPKRRTGYADKMVRSEQYEDKAL